VIEEQPSTVKDVKGDLATDTKYVYSSEYAINRSAVANRYGGPANVR